MKRSVAVIGASGYTGMEAVRILSRHKGAKLVCASSRKHAGRWLSELMGPGAPEMQYSDIDAPEVGDCEVIFSCLPHCGAMERVKKWRKQGKVVIDLSADFRLKDVKTYEDWYDAEHSAPELLKDAVYGLPELDRDAIRKADLIACPGCYPTAAILGLLPALETGWIKHNVIINAVSGVSGAGKSAKPEHSFYEISENLYAYATTQHRHTPEIEQELSKAACHKVETLFTPHLGPFNRGIYATIYAETVLPRSQNDMHDLYCGFYETDPFVRVLTQNPQLNHVSNTNFCHIRTIIDKRTGRLIIISAIDNLLKGSAGQAVQCFNLRFGFDETEGLSPPPPA